MRTRLATLTVTSALLLAGCGGSSTGASGSAGSSSAATPSATSLSASPSASSASATAPTDTITVAVKNGKVVPPTHRVTVKKGDTVRIVATTDKADEVHVHGVDIEQKTQAGKPVTIQFTAKDPGLYEVETHDSGLQLLQLVVR
ncbi:MAG: hypothetical protein QOH75_780 [Actinomycetota bacterium]|nr:hypothetical protein [Actinomycetota bacterium]